jgi:hypothetical protein
MSDEHDAEFVVHGFLDHVGEVAEQCRHNSHALAMAVRMADAAYLHALCARMPEHVIDRCAAVRADAVGRLARMLDAAGAR